MKTLVGCSGYEYEHWKGRFYPEDLPAKKHLQHYADIFNSVEINNTFYQIPSKKTLEAWKEQTPAGFLFSLKGSRYVTQMKKLKDPDEPVSRFYKSVQVLGDRLGCVLWQCPGNFKVNTDRLDAFCDALSDDFTNVLEFRHPSWWDEQVYEILENNKVVFCMVSAPGDLPETVVETAQVAYLRFHGKENWYDYDYSEEELQGWAKKCSGLKSRRLYAYFNNDVDARAPQNAQQFAKFSEDL
jgi:uncharacterized protein YecE (DUF72 family)